MFENVFVNYSSACFMQNKLLSYIKPTQKIKKLKSGELTSCSDHQRDFSKAQRLFVISYK